MFGGAYLTTIISTMRSSGLERRGVTFVAGRGGVFEGVVRRNGQHFAKLSTTRGNKMIFGSFTGTNFLGRFGVVRYTLFGSLDLGRLTL